MEQILSYQLQSAARKLLGNNRLASCCRTTVNTTQSVKVVRSIQSLKTRFCGLMRCNCVWTCPVCSRKINKIRSMEISTAIEQWKKQGNEVMLLTLTVPHSKDDNLQNLLEKLSVARRKFFNRSQYKSFASGVGVIGSLTRLEITYGRNGWHPHTHQLLFIERGGNKAAASCIREVMKEGKQVLSDSWREACEAAGLRRPSHKAGISFVEGGNAASYLTKNSTSGDGYASSKGVGPWDMLSSYLLYGDLRSAYLFREYAAATKGRRQIFPSRDLRGRIGLNDGTMRSEVTEEDIVLGCLEMEDWQLVLGKERRGELLQIAKHGQWEDVEKYLAELRHDYVAQETEGVGASGEVIAPDKVLVRLDGHLPSIFDDVLFVCSIYQLFPRPPPIKAVVNTASSVENSVRSMSGVNQTPNSTTITVEAVPPVARNLLTFE